MSDKRVITSAINGMSVQEIRSCLTELRQRWKDSSPKRLFQGHQILRASKNNKLNMYEFAFKFIKGHHAKRIKKDSSVASESQSSRNGS